jgi:enoyl-CoA hydratase/carnithine racemase
MTVSLTTPAPGVRLITLDRAEALNTLTRDLVARLGAVLDEVEADADCRTVVLTGAGRAFCAGLDLGGYGNDDAVAEHGRVRSTMLQQRDIAHLAQRLHHLRQPVIAAVNGAAAGGGLALVLASDIRIAATPAIFAVSFIRAGFSGCDIGTSWLLPRIVGAGRAHELMLTGRRFDAQEAEAIGLLSRVVEPAQLLDSALATATQIAANPPFSVELTKQGMWIALETSGFDASVEFENRQQVVTALTEDQPEAVAAFLEKRPPNYRYR